MTSLEFHVYPIKPSLMPRKSILLVPRGEIASHKNYYVNSLNGVGLTCPPSLGPGVVLKFYWTEGGGRSILVIM